LRTGYWPVEPAEASVRATTLQKYSQFEVMAPEWGLVNAETMVREGFRKNALVYRCVEFVANAISQPVLRGMREGSGGAWEELPPLDPLSRLLERPSEDYSSQTRFVKQVVRSLLVTGEAILYKVPGERTGQTVELQMLPPQKVAVERDAAGRKAYLYKYDPNREPKRLKQEEVIFLKFDDLQNADRGLAPLVAAAREADVDNAGADVRKGFLDNGAILSGILTTEQQVGEAQLKEWSAAWRANYGGPRNAGKTPALGGGLSYQEVGTSPDKIAFPEVIGLSEARICSAFGVEPVLVGAKIGLDRSTYSNYETAEKAFWKNTVPALMTLLADEFTAGLTERGEKRACRWDTDEVPALQEDVDRREQRYGRLLRNGSVRINEYREAAGLEPIDDGEFYMMPGNVTLVPAGSIGVDRSEATPDSQEAPDGTEEDPGEEGQGGGAQEDEPGGSQGGSQGDEEGRQADEHIRGGLRYQQREIGRLERRLAQAIEGVFGVWAEAVAERLADTLDPEELLDLTIEAERMAEAVAPHIRAILEEAGEETAAEEEGEFDAGEDDVAGYLEAAPLVLGFALARRTRDLIREGIAAVQAADPEGWTSEDVEERLREMIVDRDRANLAAETETVRTTNRAARFAYRQNGVAELEWFTTSDEPCEFCRAMEGRRISVEEPFAALGDEIEGADGGVRTIDYEDLFDTLHPRCGCGVRPVKE
jgi:HK97 family phage portal protein